MTHHRCGTLTTEEMYAHIGPSGKLLCLRTVETVEPVLERLYHNMFDKWEDTNLHHLLLKNSMT